MIIFNDREAGEVKVASDVIQTKQPLQLPVVFSTSSSASESQTSAKRGHASALMFIFNQKMI